MIIGYCITEAVFRIIFGSTFLGCDICLLSVSFFVQLILIELWSASHFSVTHFSVLLLLFCCLQDQYDDGCRQEDIQPSDYMQDKFKLTRFPQVCV